MSFHDFCIHTAKGFGELPVHDNGKRTVRYGQWFYNELLNVKPNLAEHIRGTDMDPFYKERVDYSCLHYLVLMWDHDFGDPQLV